MGVPIVKINCFCHEKQEHNNERLISYNDIVVVVDQKSEQFSRIISWRQEAALVAYQFTCETNTSATLFVVGSDLFESS
jgi:hypothetical protein